MAVEFVVGLIAGSLALISDAAHMLTDAAAIALALVADPPRRPPREGRLHVRPAPRRDPLRPGQRHHACCCSPAGSATRASDGCSTHPRSRAGSCWSRRWSGSSSTSPPPGASAGPTGTSLNVEGAFQHILNDLYAFIATAIAGLVVLTTGFAARGRHRRARRRRADDQGGLGAAARERPDPAGGRAAPASTPTGSAADLAAAGGRRRGARPAHWVITSGEPALSAHVLVGPDVDCHAARLAIEQVLRADRITHTTLQVDHQEDGRTRSNSARDRPTGPCTGRDQRTG